MSVILITGTSTGIGRASAGILARNKHTVYATMRTPERNPDLESSQNPKTYPLLYWHGCK